MNRTKLLLLLTALMVATSPVMQATLLSYNFTSGFNNGGVVPDANPGGWNDTRAISGISGEIEDVNVRLNLTGGYNGDIYAYVVHSSGFAVLLNRVGRTSSSSFGYSDAGMTVILDDQNARTSDIHLYQTESGYDPGMIAGYASWRPDGRNADPATVLNTDSRSAFLSSFNGTAVNGDWTLYLADFASDGTTTVASWGLDITVVPEPVNVALAVFAAIGMGVVVLKRKFASTDFASRHRK